jgi:cytochrome b561
MRPAAVWSRAVLSLLWPTKRNVDRGRLVLLGRVLHWAAAILSLLCLALAIWSGVESTLPERGNDYWSTKHFAFELGKAFLGLALLTYLAGRVGRGLLSKE